MRTLLILLLLIAFSGCKTLHPTQKGTKPIDHGGWEALLLQHVDEEGMVDYQGFKRDRKHLGIYLGLLSNNAPNDKYWSRNDQLAYWVNAYNAFTVELVLRYYPVESIKDIGSSIQVPFVNTPWDIKFIKIAGKEYDLNNIEHNILRKYFKEPRVHFAVVCAAQSCPRMRQQAYSGQNVQELLEEDARQFINDSTRNKLSREKVSLSKIFDWYKEDFTDGQSLIDYLNQYSKVQIDKNAEVDYLEYVWGLNEVEMR